MWQVCLFFALLFQTASMQTAPTVGGVWTLNRAASELPREIGFNAEWLQQQPSGDSGASAPSGNGGGGRRRGGGGGGGRSGTGPYGMPRESFDEAQRTQFLTGEARTPPARLTIVDAGSTITLTTELGQSRTLHPTGHDEAIEVGGVTLIETTKRDADKVVVSYSVTKDRLVRYTLTPSANPARLVVDVEFLDHGTGDKAKLVYDGGVGNDTADAPAAGGTPAGSSGLPASRPAEATPPGTDTRPGAELRGLKAIGILVEQFGPEAQSCGLNHDTVESALAKKLTDAGFVVQRNSDEDTYLYVNVQTSTVGAGTCVSRYDAFLYTHAAATLSYRQQPALVQVSLIHRGGIGSSGPAAHGPAVTRALEAYVDVMATSIRDANK